MTKPNWINDLARGDVGEKDFLNTFPLYRKIDDSQMYEADFVDPAGNTIELKTDYYSMQKTPNLAVERYSNIEKGTPGGPYRHSDKLTHWVYYYKKNGVFLFYDALQLIEVIEELEPTLVTVKNSTYTTGIYLIPRREVEECLTQVIKLPSVID